MHYTIRYACLSHVGNIRRINQDNFLCNGMILENPGDPAAMAGTAASTEDPAFGIFDGMGGEECGEIASRIAAETADSFVFSRPSEELADFCFDANAEICEFADRNGIASMGTTAALIVFGRKRITVCNIGDSRIYRFSKGELTRISVDHVVNVYGSGRKPPLSQNLGIPEEEMILEPYLAEGKYSDKDRYLLCSDGLTDMVTEEEIALILQAAEVERAAAGLLERALKNGGRDNITIILCSVHRALF
ncbi:MAG: protein phosphatase 2C domain-containing protein [Lachnospiraceae bacterium]|nr:protein phosphatase 2C domain-containing protein [Lachnospiraceae bacterium]